MGGPYYPIHDLEPLMKGLVIGGMGIVHVFLAQFAIGGGILMTYFEWLGGPGRFAPARRLVESYFTVLVLVSFVLGAVTGVGMWLTAVQVSPRTIGLMVDTFHWIWATEWLFFLLEVAAGYAYYRFRDRLSDRERITFLSLYSIAGLFSLFWINGILAWQLTPGRWIMTQNLWDGFFNPSFLPTLIFRVVACLAIASLVAAFVIDSMKEEREIREQLLRRAARFLAPMSLMPLLALWFLAVIPADSREWVLGGSPTMMLFMSVGAGASMLIGAYALVGILWRRLYINGATALLLIGLAFGASAGGEFVREGSRKPYTVRATLYSNAMTQAELEHFRRIGSVTNDPYPLVDPERYPTEQLQLGAKVYRFQCSVCHTMEGANGLVHLTRTWTDDQLRLNVSKLQRTKAFMPPFGGNATELEALVQLLRWRAVGMPSEWADSKDPKVQAQIGLWLEEAGTEPMTSQATRRRPEDAR